MGDPSEKREVCLVMIVRDEAHVIERCLASVRPVITQWCIVDTGSKDDTRQRIRAALADLPGELHQRPWVDFGHNRSESLALAAGRGDWLLLIDADEELRIAPAFRLPDLADDTQAWKIRIRLARSGKEFLVPRLLRSDHPWHFEGVLHEHLASREPYRQGVLPGLLQLSHSDSARNRRSRREKYLADAAVLERALAEKPGDSRYQYYLAQSLRDAGELERAIEAYRRRIAMGGWREELFWSQFHLARLLEVTKAARSEVRDAFLAASTILPDRAEPLVELARLHREDARHARALRYARKAAALEKPEDGAIEASYYQWRAQDELAVNLYWTGNLRAAAEVAERLLASEELPAAEKARLRRNLARFRAESAR